MDPIQLQAFFDSLKFLELMHPDTHQMFGDFRECVMLFYRPEIDMIDLKPLFGIDQHPAVWMKIRMLMMDVLT